MRRKEEASQQQQLSAAKRAYKAAAEEGNRQEEARWANVVGDIHKNRGEYVQALRWLRKDYDISVKYLPDKQLLATCQSLGELYFRLHEYNNALIYQRKHLELAKDENDLIGQQRASTQLGRTYHEMFLNSDDDHCAVQNAKKYFNSSMKLAQTIKENPRCVGDPFLKEYIDAHNNLGMLETDLDNLDEAEKILLRGLEICDEEEVIEDDDTRSRLHHNLGKVYLELRKWENAKEHIRKDILICQRIGHCQGEAKGFINLGELYYRNQIYNEAISSYQKALDLAKSLEDEHALANQIRQNMETVREAEEVMSELKKEEQNLKKLERNTQMARGTESERKSLLKQNASLDCLVEKSMMIFSWIKLRNFGKKKKRLAWELCDKEKLGDSFLVVGESYQKLRNFGKALKWYQKGWETYRSIGNLEGQALARINIGDAHRIAVNGNLSSLQLTALENIHYSHMIRFDDSEEARRTKLLIDKLKQSKNKEGEPEGFLGDCCSETETELDNLLTDDRSDGSFSMKKYKPNPLGEKSSDVDDELNEKVPIISLLQSNKITAKPDFFCGIAPIATSKSCGSPTRSISRSTCSFTANRKRVRLILSDDEGEKEDCRSERMVRKCSAEGIATSDELTRKMFHQSPQDVLLLLLVPILRIVPVPTNPGVLNQAYRILKISEIQEHVKLLAILTLMEMIIVSIWAPATYIKANLPAQICMLAVINLVQHIIFKIDQEFVHMDLDLCVGAKFDLEQTKAELACLYYLQLPREKRSRAVSWGTWSIVRGKMCPMFSVPNHYLKIQLIEEIIGSLAITNIFYGLRCGKTYHEFFQRLVPVIQHMKYSGKVIESIETLFSLRNHAPGENWIEVSIGVMVAKHVMKLYIDCCEELLESPNLNVVRELYNLEVSEDEIVVSDCQLRDVSVIPLLNALQLHKTLAVLDLSHNFLGNETVEKLKQVFISFGQNYGGLVLNLHSNQLGPAALFQICECPVLYARLEVLNISGNSLTDACASYLSTILRACKALYSLDIGNCSITSRTIQKVADSLDSESVLTHLYIGRNQPVSGNALMNLLLKLATLHRFQELNLNCIKLSKPVVDSLCRLANNCCLSGLLLGNTNIGTEGAIQLIKPLSKDTQDLARLDLSFCGLTSDYIVRLRDDTSLISGILELNLGGNPIMKEVLVVCKCEVGLAGIICLLQALSDNHSLEELNLADNVSPIEIRTLTDSLRSADESSNSLGEGVNQPDSSTLPHAMCDENQKRVVLSECQSTRQLSASIKLAGNLKLLDLSSNGFSQKVIDILFSAWSSGARAVVAQRHVEGDTVHLSVQGNKCCGIKPCCRKI
ncbi:hypothetical protein OROGR_008108 [Orobanche gracilis]